MINSITRSSLFSRQIGLWKKLGHPSVQSVFFKVISCLCFSGVSGIVRYFTIQSKETGLIPLPAPELAFFETLFGLLFILPWVLSAGKSVFRVTFPLLYVGRALMVSMAIILWFTSLSKMPIIYVIAFKHTAPFFTILGAKLFLDEKCGWARAIAIGMAFSGALMITGHELIKGSFSLLEIGLFTLYPLGATLCYAMSTIFAKNQLKNDTPQTIYFYLFLLCLPILGSTSFFHWVVPYGWQWPYFIIMGGLTALTYIFLHYAYRIADVIYLVPTSFMRLIAAATIGMIFFEEWPTLWAWFGSFLILLATVGLCHHEARKIRI